MGGGAGEGVPLLLPLLLLPLQHPSFMWPCSCLCSAPLTSPLVILQLLVLVSSCLCLPALAYTGPIAGMVHCCCPHWHYTYACPLIMHTHLSLHSFVFFLVLIFTYPHPLLPLVALVHVHSFVHLVVCAGPCHPVMLAWPLFVFWWVSMSSTASPVST